MITYEYTVKINCETEEEFQKILTDLDAYSADPTNPEVLERNEDHENRTVTYRTAPVH